ncbi:MAG: adenine nucleotide alpha hydrolase [Betaproteobacteria bacterium]|nr:adenine nucleotide alpha hydrolase [Betaproteobacteria bacterium]
MQASPPPRKRTLLAWSSGKDSAWSLHLLRRASDVEVAGLFTTVVQGSGRVAVHEVRTELLEAQSASLGLPVHRIPIPHPCPNAVYEAAIAVFIAQAIREGVTHVAFGDLFLEDIRRYRERQFAGSGVELLFPLWELPTRALAQEMTESGLRAWITCVDPRQAPREWAGALFDRDFVRRIPEGVDACGERGEFHTFAFAGPMFRKPLATRAGEIFERDGFVYADVLSCAAC